MFVYLEVSSCVFVDVRVYEWYVCVCLGDVCVYVFLCVGGRGELIVFGATGWVLGLVVKGVDFGTDVSFFL